MGPTHRLAIDLGTCHTVAVVRRGDEAPRALLFDGSPVMASGIYADETGRLSVGRDAERLSQLAPERFEPYPKRSVDEGSVLLGAVEVTVVEMLAALLRRAAEESLQAGVNPVGSTVLTCPADWGGQRRGVLLEAARAANLGPVVLVDEPIAAATYCLRVLGQQVAPLQSLAVFDFGGGTLDVSVVRREFDGLRVLGVGGLDDLGGVDIDAALVGHLGQLINLRHPELWQRLSNPDSTAAHRDRRALWTEVRAAKEMLSRASSAPIHVPGTEEALHLTREELERVAGPLIDRAVDETRRVLERAGVDVRQLAGIFLVGGSSRIPLVASRLHARFGVAPVVPEQPELPVAYGGMLAVATAPQQQFDAPPVPGPQPVSGMPVSPARSPGFPQPPAYPVSGFPAPSSPAGAYGSPAGVSQTFAAASAPTSAPPGSTPPEGLRPQSPAGYAGPGQPLPGQPLPGQQLPGQTRPGPGAPGMPGMPGQRPPMPPTFGAPPGSQGAYGPAPVMVRPRRRTWPWVAMVIVLAVIGSCVWGGNKIFGWMGDQFESAKDNFPGVTSTDENGQPKDADIQGLQAGSPITLTTGGSLAAIAGPGSVYTAAVSAGATDVTGYSATGGQKWNVKLQMEPKDVFLTLVGNLLLVDGEGDTKRDDGDTRGVIDVATGTEKWTKPWDDHQDLLYAGTDVVTEVGGFRKAALERVDLLTGTARWSHAGDQSGSYINGERSSRPSIRWPGEGAPADVVVPTYTLSFGGRTPYRESLTADTGVAVQLMSDTKASTIDLKTGQVKATGTITKSTTADSWLVYNDLVMFKPDADNTIVAYKVSDMTKAWEFKATAGTSVDDLRPCGEKLVCVKGEQSSKDTLIAIDTATGTAKWTRVALADKKDTKSTRTSDPNWYVLAGKLVGGTGTFTIIDQAAVLDPASGNDQFVLGKGLAQQNVYAGVGGIVAIMSYHKTAFRISIVNIADGRILGGADITPEILQLVSLSGDTAVVLDKDNGKVYRYAIPAAR